MKRMFKNEVSDLPTEKSSVIDLPTEKRSVIDLPTEMLPSIPAEEKQVNTKRKSVQLLGKGLFLGAFIVLAIFGIVYVWSYSISISKAHSEAFTELYFENYLQLPSEVVPEHSYTFQFTLHNLEGKDMEYSYEVYREVGQDKSIFDKGTIFVKENAYQTIQERFATADSLPKSEIVVDLINEKQQIDFWIEGSV